MRLTVVGVGRLKDDAERQLVDRYLERLKGGRSIGLSPVAEKEIAEARHASATERQEFEAQRLLQIARDADLLVVLDAAGRQFSSASFAKWLGAERDRGARHAAFLLGGPDGHGQAALDAAQMRLSLGMMTLPHGLARVLLVEQLYRATTILAGHPYHRA
ncbi:MAG: 23S rRNA (pseudouridine(1915)-N(3))-methyltransferase RlmH [Hyphomicrobiaceae bacterium]|nr:23S rRNA (pseudouridine(1915)-N(3))-methyltransferase RlmH [Hyphomicrobiaceae bacterium]